MVVVQHGVDINLTSALSLLASLTCERLQGILIVRSIGIKLSHIWLTCIVMTSCCIQAKTTRELQVLDDVPIQLQLAIETLLLILVLVVVQDIIWVGNAVWSIIVTWHIEWIVQVLQFCDTDITWSLHDTVVHRPRLLTSGYEVVLLVSIVGRHAQCHIFDLVGSTARECVFIVAISICRNDTIIVNLRQAQEEVAGISSTIERHAVVIADTCIEEVLHIVLDGTISLVLLRVIVNITISQG